jgi:2-oxoglutarate dehydrogenase E1 component
MIPMLDHLIQRAGAQGVQETVIGMAHRGRLNVLVNTLGKMPADPLLRVRGQARAGVHRRRRQVSPGLLVGRRHAGGPMHLTLAFNPSHLEIVNPVVEGSVPRAPAPARRHEGRRRASGSDPWRRRGGGPGREPGSAEHGADARLLHRRHDPHRRQQPDRLHDVRSARHARHDLLHRHREDGGAPILHVNGDDPEVCLLAIEIALDYRQQFHKDVFIDLVCFRRLGHNEADEPMVTQPLMYKKIAQHPGTRKLYADKLVAEGVVKPDEPEAMIATYRNAADKGLHTNTTILANYKPALTVDWSSFKGTDWTEPYQSKVPLKTLKALSKQLAQIPEGFKIHPRVERVIADRKAMGEGKLPLDWGMGETLAYATLLNDGYGVRLSGQDIGRGTFAHRHAVLHDQNREKWDSGTWIPLEHVKPGQPTFEVIDSVLTENAVLGFEYGYTTSDPQRLVIWEAQFGDFANGAQVVIDQFIASGEAKWGRICSLVMFLPHGYEGQGPEHSSARPERYLQLCAEHNMQVCVPSTPAQIYHLLRRQMIRHFRKPLIVMSPKSLLRHKDAVSSLDELADGQFQNVIGEIEAIPAKGVKRVIACSGKVYYELVAYRQEHKIRDVAILRVEQQYPFPHDDFRAALAKYPQAKEVVWCQEEPQNQGAWYRLRAYLRADTLPKQIVAYAGRPVSASTAVGYMSKHLEQQKQLIEGAFGPNLVMGEMLVAT